MDLEVTSTNLDNLLTDIDGQLLNLCNIAQALGVDHITEAITAQREALTDFQPLLRAAPDLVAVLAALLLSCELNTDDIEEHTLRLCYRAYKVLKLATGKEMGLIPELNAVAYDPVSDTTICRICYADRTTDGAESCCYCGNSYDNPTTEREEVQA